MCTCEHIEWPWSDLIVYSRCCVFMQYSAASDEYTMGQAMFSGTVQHSPHVLPSPSVRAGGSAGGDEMNPGRRQYSMPPPQQFPTNLTPRPQMFRSLLQSSQHVYGQTMTHSGSPGHVSSAYGTRPGPWAYGRWPAGYGRPMFPPAGYVPRPRVYGHPQSSGNMCSGQFPYSHSQMPPRPLNYAVATSGAPTPTQSTLQSSRQQVANTGASYPSLLANIAPPSSVAAEGADSVNQATPTSSIPLVAPQPVSVPQRTPIQQETTQVRPSPAHSPSFTVNQAPPVVASRTTEGFTPESTQQQPCVPQPGPQVRNDVHKRSMHVCSNHMHLLYYCSSMLCDMWWLHGFYQRLNSRYLIM